MPQRSSLTSTRSLNRWARKPRRAAGKSKRRVLRHEVLETRRVLASFLKIEGPELKGDSTIDGRKDEIVLDSFRWGFGAQFNPPADPNFFAQDFTFLKLRDRATPQLMKESIFGLPHDKATYTLTVPISQQQKDVFKIELTKPQVTQFSTIDQDDSAVGEELESVGLSFTGIQFEYQAFDTMGSPDGGAFKAKWDLTTNKVDPTPKFPAAIAEEKAPPTGAFLTIAGRDIAIDSFDWGANLFVQFPASGKPFVGGSFAGDFNFTRRLDKATVGLFSTAAGGESLAKSITLTNQRSIDGKDVTNVEWTLYDPAITNFAISSDDTAGSFQNDISISFSKIEVEYTPFDFKGNPKTPIDSFWDLSKQPNLTEGEGDFGGNKSTSTIPDRVLIFPDKSELEFGSMQWNESNSFQLGGKSSEVNFGEMVFTAPMDESTPGLIATLASGQSGKFMVKHSSVINEERMPFFQWDLSDAFVTSYRASGSSDSTVEPTVSFGLSFAKAEIQQTDRDENGKNPVTSKTFWDVSGVPNTTDPRLGGRKLDRPNLELTFVDDGVTSDVEIDAIDWGVFGNEFGPISIDAERDAHSLGVFWSVASGQTIDQATIKRHTTINNQRVELYRLDLFNVVLTDYFTTSVVDVGNAEQFSIAPSRVKLTTNEFDFNGNSTATRSVDWNLVDNKVTSSNVKDLGETLPGTPLQQLEFEDGSKLDLDAFFWSADLPVGPPSALGTRPVGTANAGEFSFQTTGPPSVAQLNALAAGQTLENPVKVQSSFSTQSKPVAYANWELNGALAITSYQFSDQKFSPPGSGFNSFSIAFDKVDLKANQFDANGNIVNKTDVAWDTKANIVSGSGGFGSFKFASPPDIKLTVTSDPAQPELEVLEYSWDVSNPVDQLIGSTVPASRLGPARTQFAILAQNSEAAAGFIATMARGQLIPELTVTSFDSNDQPHRQWNLTDVFLSHYSTTNTSDIAPGSIELVFDIGVVESIITDPESPSGAGARVARAEAAAAPTISTGFLDFISPPQSTGFTDIQAFDLSTPTIPLPDHFTDEQEPSANLDYAVSVVSNPSLIASTQINAAKELVVQFQTGQTGTATLMVTATDIFDLEASDTFDIVVGLAPDFGDAPAPYPTTIADGGASHDATGPRLGPNRDREVDGTPSAAADGDDVNGDDEDGVMFGRITPGGSMAAVNILLENAASGRIDAWIDFNRDGDWDDPGEQILTSALVSNAVQTLNYTLPVGLTTGDTVARVRLSSAGGLGPKGNAIDGEVEDYIVSIGPLRVESVVINQGDVQRSSLDTVRVTFDRVVDIDSASGDPFKFINTNTSDPVADVPVITQVDGKTVVDFTFGAGASVTSFGSLIDGNYQLTIDASLVSAFGVNLDGDENGSAGGNYLFGDDSVDAFFRKYGDDNGNDVVDLLDFAAFRRTFGEAAGDSGYADALDSDGDDRIGLLDFAAFRRNFGT